MKETRLSSDRAQLRGFAAAPLHGDVMKCNRSSLAALSLAAASAAQAQTEIQWWHR
jgi:hypothetical protein